MKKFLEEFKAFAMKGNMMDLAVGMVIGAAFTSIVNSLVNDMIMPLLSIFTKSIDFTNLFLAMDGQKYASLKAAQDSGAAVLAYGNFLTAILNFLIVAFALFLVMKQINRFMKKKDDAEKAAPTEMDCPYCKEKIKIGATKCPHCASMIKAD
ncbi:MAG: large conductance mechanosensitive channel protein MscL [Lachnospiraceae bacterium]|nr:large conductance mechanosensitive channel protein MscL [Lachnospiraceae bacterium]